VNFFDSFHLSGNILDFDAYRLLVFIGFEQLKSKSNKTNNNNTNFNNIYLILSGSEETSLWMGYDGFQ
jgi:hypothetical protein